jgi:hypothetical protein
VVRYHDSLLGDGGWLVEPAWLLLCLKTSYARCSQLIYTSRLGQGLSSQANSIAVTLRSLST